MSTQTNTCAVTIAGPDRRVDVVVSTETPIRQLIPTFVELSVEAPPLEDGPQPVWAIAPPGKQPLAPDSTLSESGIVDGAVLSLTQLRSQPRRRRRRGRRTAPSPAAGRRASGPRARCPSACAGTTAP